MFSKLGKSRCLDGWSMSRWIHRRREIGMGDTRAHPYSIQAAARQGRLVFAKMIAADESGHRFRFVSMLGIFS